MKWIGFLFIAVSVNAEVTNLSFPKDLSRFKFENIYENPKAKNMLSVWRRLEIDKKYKECASKGPTLIAKNKVLSGWIMAVWSNCVFKQVDEKMDSQLVMTYLDNIRLNNQKALQGPWRGQILNQLQKIVALSIAHIDKEPPKKEVSKKDRAKKDQAKNLEKFKTRLMSFLEQDEVYQNVEIRKWFQTQLDLKQPSFNFSTRGKFVVDAVPEESNSDVKRLVNLDDFVSGDLSTSIVQIEPIMDSLKSLYRKMEYKKVVEVGSRLETHYRSSELYRDYSMLMGKSFQFLGEYGKAMEHFKVVLSIYPESADFEEALFRVGLIQIRSGSFGEAQKVFQRLVHLDRDKYDITGRYWWIRTLQYNKDPREMEEKTKFANDFPFSYYGLRIKAELNNGKIKPTKGAEMPAISWSLTGKTAEVWQRFIKLAELGWILEAQQEMQTFSWPQNPLKVYYLSLVLSRADLHPLTVKNVTPLLEAYNEVRTIDAIKDIYPKTYLKLIVKEKDKYPLHEHLILSLIRQESSFGLKALSTSNAAGLMQMIQPTALEVADRLKMKIDFPEDLYKPEVNVPMGVFYIHLVLKEMSMHVPLALAGYNAGPHKIRQFISLRDVTKKISEGAVDKEYPGLEEMWVDELPWAETTGYVKSILRNTLIYELIEKGEIQYRPDFWRDFVLK